MLLGWDLWRSPSPTYYWAHKLCLSLAPKCLFWLWCMPTKQQARANWVSMLRRRISGEHRAEPQAAGRAEDLPSVYQPLLYWQISLTVLRWFVWTDRSILYHTSRNSTKPGNMQCILPAANPILYTPGPPKKLKKKKKCLRHSCWFDPHTPEQLCVGTPCLSDHCKLIKGFLHHVDNYYYSKCIDSLKNLAQTQ